MIRQAHWTLARVMWVADRGFSSAANRRELRRGGGHYIIGEKLRSGSAEAGAALSLQGRYQHVRENLQVKEVKIADDERFVICFNPEQAERDAALREVMVGKLVTMITDTDRLSPTKRDGSTCFAAPTRTCQPRTSCWATSSYSRSNVVGGT